MNVRMNARMKVCNNECKNEWMDDDDIPIIDSTHPQRYIFSIELQTHHCSWDESYYAATENLSSCASLCL